MVRCTANYGQNTKSQSLQRQFCDNSSQITTEFAKQFEKNVIDLLSGEITIRNEDSTFEKLLQITLITIKSHESSLYQAKKCQVLRKQLLFIEESVDVRQRISEHLESKTWDGILIPDSEVFCFSYAPFDPELTSEDHERIAHAFAYKFKPVCDKGPRTLTAPKVRTQIECDGDIAYLESNFTPPF